MRKYVLFFPFICEAKGKKSTKRKEKHADFLCPLGILIKWLLQVNLHSFSRYGCSRSTLEARCRSNFVCSNPQSHPTLRTCKRQLTIVSVIVQAQPATSIQTHARKGVVVIHSTACFLFLLLLFFLFASQIKRKKSRIFNIKKNLKKEKH